MLTLASESWDYRHAPTTPRWIHAFKVNQGRKGHQKQLTKMPLCLEGTIVWKSPHLTPHTLLLVVFAHRYPDKLWVLGGHIGMCGFRHACAMACMRSQDNPGCRPSPSTLFETGPLCCFSTENSQLAGWQASRNSTISTSTLPAGVQGLQMFAIHV